MITFGATLILLGELIIFIGELLLFVELRRNFMAIRQTQAMVNLFMDELLHPQLFKDIVQDETKK